jgi:hypothetical protein
MPRIDDLKNKKQKVFKKVSYRPWDTELEDTQRSEPQSPVPQNKESVPEKIKNEFSCEDVKKEICGLYGVQKNILIFLAKNTSTEDDSYCYTNHISHKEIMDHVHSSRASISSSLTRLKTKGLVYSVANKPGRGGFALYKIPKEIYIGLREKFSEDFA